MVTERRRDFPAESALKARKRVGKLLDINEGTMRGCIERVEVDTGVRPGTTTDVSEELTRLRRENAELRRANDILKTASACFAAAELDRRLS